MADINLTKVPIGQQDQTRIVEVVNKLVDEAMGRYAAHGSLYYDENGGTLSIACATAGTAYDITGLTANESNLTTLDAANGTITVNSDGLFTCNLDLSSGVSLPASPNLQAHAYIVKNGTKVAQAACQRTIKSQNDVGDFGAGPIEIRLNVGDVVKLQIESSANNTTFEINHLQFGIRRLVRDYT
ncbi:MAG: hypothetical protein ACXABY_04095 [Candidatus Thorarchaeota archaeon]|jgi:hypothetical protein